MQGVKYYRSARISDSSGWLVNLFTPAHEAMESIRRAELILFAVILMIIAILLIVTTYFARHITQPLSEMQGLMKEVRHENFDIHANEDREDELGSLARAFEVPMIVAADNNQQELAREFVQFYVSGIGQKLRLEHGECLLPSLNMTFYTSMGDVVFPNHSNYYFFAIENGRSYED